MFEITSAPVADGSAQEFRYNGEVHAIISSFTSVRGGERFNARVPDTMGISTRDYAEAFTYAMEKLEKGSEYADRMQNLRDQDSLFA